MIKIITGFRDDQYFVIENDEAHKAYFLFNNPEARTIFKNGVALIGKHIQGIEPAYNEMMGYNPTHKLDGYDWNEIRRSGKEKEMKEIMQKGKEVAQIAERNKSVLSLPMSECLKLLA